MPTIELLAEVQALRKRVSEYNEAVLMYCKRTLKAEERAHKLKQERDLLVQNANDRDWEIDHAMAISAELAALKKDARACACMLEKYITTDAARRILEATKEGKNGN